MSHYVRLHELYTNTVDTVSKTRKNIPPLHELTLSLHVRNIKTAIFQRFQICVLRSRVTALRTAPAAVGILDFLGRQGVHRTGY